MVKSVSLPQVHRHLADAALAIENDRSLDASQTRHPLLRMAMHGTAFAAAGDARDFDELPAAVHQ